MSTTVRVTWITAVNKYFNDEILQPKHQKYSKLWLRVTVAG